MGEDMQNQAGVEVQVRSVREAGSVLIVALALLVVMTITAVTAMRISTTDQRIVANQRDRSLALQAAEAAIKDGEAYLGDNLPDESNFDGTGGLYAHDTTVAPPPASITSANSRKYGDSLSGSNLNGIKTQPRYVIEERPKAGGCSGSSMKAGATAAEDSDPRTFEITAVGTGGSDDSQVILRTGYRPNCS